MPNIFSHPYQLDEAISNFNVVGWYLSFYSDLKRNFCKPDNYKTSHAGDDP